MKLNYTTFEGIDISRQVKPHRNGLEDTCTGTVYYVDQNHSVYNVGNWIEKKRPIHVGTKTEDA